MAPLFSLSADENFDLNLKVGAPTASFLKPNSLRPQTKLSASNRPKTAAAAALSFRLPSQTRVPLSTPTSSSSQVPMRTFFYQKSGTPNSVNMRPVSIAISENAAVPKASKVSSQTGLGRETG